jgi:hypothetical protein
MEDDEKSQKQQRRITRLLRGAEVTPKMDEPDSQYQDMLLRLARSQNEIGERYWVRSFKIDKQVKEQAAALEAEIKELKDSLEEKAKSLAKAREAPGDVEKIQEMQATIDELQRKQRLEFLLSRVNSKAQKLLLGSESFRASFLEQKECDSFVLSVDIRRSTELMLKARSPEHFAAFITQLCTEFLEIITKHFGVFDKFTGDGVLAFFPEFYTGEDAGVFTLNAALECHAAFQRHYRANRNSFSSILTDVGLGIGIDYGKTHLLQMAGGLTVVGVPVVYACRLGGAPAGSTYLNQPAFEKISTKVGSGYSFDEESLEIKHEGCILAYDARSSGLPVDPKPPAWVNEVENLLG